MEFAEEEYLLQLKLRRTYPGT